MDNYSRGIITNMKKIICSGALFYTLSTNRFLFLHRAQSKQSNVWGLVGGTNEELETPWEGLQREIKEEIGFLPKIKKVLPLETFVSNDDHFRFHTYLCLVNDEFIPTLNSEHNGYCWTSFNNWPRPLHQGLSNTLKSKTNIRKLETVFEIIKLFN
jgi:ADP-ribose pyrophosphatase YjhB (NUDIX family)